MSKHYHLIGIGGIGMSGIAQLLLRRGERVSGSDIKESRLTQELREAGAKIFIGHQASNLAGADVVIYSTAIKQDNPEIQEAERLKVSLIRRAQGLADLMQEKTVITVTGSHGKTTTTALISYLLLEAGFRPTVAIGGILKNTDNQAWLGEGEFFVAEADESDGTFLYYRPEYSIVTNIDHEHLDYYKNFGNELSAFKEFIHQTRPEGCLFFCSDDVNLKNLTEGYPYKYVSFGLSPDAEIHPENIKINGFSCEFDCLYRHKFVERFSLALAGRHNISNALSVIALGLELGIDLRCVKKTLADFKGACRRTDIKFDADGYLLIDDYAHHPTEIRATLAAIRNFRGRVIAVFQPHRYTRTKLLLEEFAQSFALADVVYVTDIYPASEPVLEGVTAELVCERIKKYNPDKEVRYLNKEEIVPRIMEIVKPGDLVITLGAGDIVKVCDELAKEFKRQGQVC